MISNKCFECGKKNLMSGYLCAIMSTFEYPKFNFTYCSKECIQSYVSRPHIYAPKFVEHIHQIKLEPIDIKSPHDWTKFKNANDSRLLGPIRAPLSIKKQNDILNKMTESMYAI